MIDHLAARQVEVLTFDVTSSELAEAGLSCIRVLTPGLCLLDVESDARFHGQPRLLALARQFGVTELNPALHPFP